jgi:DNA-binding GntR family transcriptional regulator
VNSNPSVASARPSGPQPVADLSRRRQVWNRLHEDVITGLIQSGTQLKQDVIAAEMGVSQGSVREALRLLESEGLVHHVPNHGVFVNDFSIDELTKLLLPLRLSIESYAVPLGLERLRGVLRAELESIIQEMDRAARGGDLSLVNELDVRFHELTVEASESPHALQLWRSVQPRIRMQFYRFSPRHRDPMEIVDEHKALLDAILTADEATLHRALTEHIVDTTASLLNESGDGESR